MKVDYVMIGVVVNSSVDMVVVVMKNSVYVSVIWCV